MPTPHHALPTSRLLVTIADECARPVASDLHALVTLLRSRLGDALSAMLFYGSCLRDGVTDDGLVDLYAVVDDYANIDAKNLGGLVSRWLPPTVFLIHTQTPDGRVVRAKCALMTLKEFESGTSSWFQSYLWGRFCQPSRLVYCRDETTRFRVHVALANAVKRAMRESLALQGSSFSSSAFWEKAFSLTYATELRPEAANRPARIVSQNAAYYARVTSAAEESMASILPDLTQPDTYCHSVTPAQQRHSRWRWKLRRYQGRALNVLRLIKSFFTFEDGVGYVIWKLERHLGEPVEVSPRLRRFPLIFCWPLLWRLVKDRRLR